MNLPVNAADQALAQLRKDFQGHRIWRATRHDGLLGDWVATLHDPKAGVYATIVCDSAEELRKALAIELSRATGRPTGQRSRWDRW